MIKKDIIYNKDYLVILPIEHKNLQEEFEYSFSDVLIFNASEKVSEQFNTIKNSNFKQIIFVNYLEEYQEFIHILKNNHEIKFIFTMPLGSFSNEHIFEKFNSILSLYNEKMIDKIAFCDINLYHLFKDNINCCHIMLNIKRKERNSTFSSLIGLLNNQDNPMHSFYNELSALKFNNYKASFKEISLRTKEFANLFGIDYVVSNSLSNLVNLYINFTDNNNTVFLRSMDCGIPCIIGNNELLKGNVLYDFLTVKSDDNIDEISDKIEFVKKNRNKILNEYNHFREEYDKISKIKIEEFLGIKHENVSSFKDKYKYLLSIIVPVYNTEKYIDKCLKSIIYAIPKSLMDKVEILIINDGSVDKSELIIEKYRSKYKNLIKYIYQENKGLGNVRNVALKNVSGKYIASIDSDDEIDRNFFKSCLTDLENDVDVVIFNWLSLTLKGNFETSAIEWIFNDVSRYEGLLYSSIMPSTCNKIIKKELFDKLDINYLEDKYEDLSTNPFILFASKTIKYINKPYYHYYIRSNSIMRSSAGLSMINVIGEVARRIEKYKEYINIDICKFKYYTFAFRIEEYILNQAYDLEENDREEYIKYIYDNLYDVIKEIFENKHYINMINNLNDDKKKFISLRNDSFINKKFQEFVKNNKKVIKLNASIIYFGDEQ